jgi:hypothetical protein
MYRTFPTHAAALNEAKAEAGILQKRRGEALQVKKLKPVVEPCEKDLQVHVFNA